MSNVFKGAKFGDKFVCRDGTLALFLSYGGNMKQYVRTYQEGFGVVVVNLSGLVTEGEETNGDIIRKHRRFKIF